MADFNSVAEIEQAIQAAKTAEDIGDIFRDVFAYGTRGFSSSSTIAVDALYTALERLCNKEGTPSAIELRDLSSTLNAANRLTYNISEEVSKDNYAFKILIEATRDIDSNAIKQEAENVGRKILEQIDQKYEFLDKIDFEPQYAVYRKMLERLRGEYFTAARKDMAKAISDKMQCKDPIPPIDMLCHLNDVDSVSYSNFPVKYWSALEEYKKARNECFEHPSDTWIAYQSAKAEAEGFINSLLDKFESIHEQVASALNAQTEISHEQALEWAKANVYMDKNVERKLSRIKYPKSKLIEDVAEFYRYVGGKLAPIEFIGTRSARAFAYSSRCQIAISRYFDKRTLFHECGHIMEFVDTISLDCSGQFRDNRARGPVETLRLLTGNSDYGASEVAVPDNFISPYVGKVYDHASSEVFSMAIENMARPDLLVKFIKGDPEHFALFLGVCAHNNPELSDRLKLFSKNTGNRKSNEADQEKKFNEWENAIKKACPSFFMEALLDREGVDGFYIWSNSDNPTAKSKLIQRHPEKPNYTLYITHGGTIAANVKAAYLAIMAIRKEIIFTEIDTPSHENLIKICKRYIRDEEVPDWFNKDTRLPQLELPPDVLAKAKKSSPKAFLAAVAAASPPDLFEKLQTPDGVGGFYIPKRFSMKDRCIYLVHKETERELWCSPKAILPMAYFMIMNMRNLLPEHESSLYSADMTFSRYAKGKSVPDWFDPDTPLPELKYD